MKQTLTQQWVQDWGLLDLRPMHRALLRRTVAQLERTGAPDPKMQCEREVSWHIESWRDSSDQALLEMIRRPGVLVVDFDGLVKRVREDRQRDTQLDAIHHRSNCQIRLLWHWSLQGKKDLLWCTEMSFDGVIYEGQTLHQWLRACLRQGTGRKFQSSSLLTGIQLPNLVTPNMTSPNHSSAEGR